MQCSSHVSAGPEKPPEFFDRFAVIADVPPDAFNRTQSHLNPEIIVSDFQTEY
jgi:hypothetical protein